MKTLILSMLMLLAFQTFRINANINSSTIKFVVKTNNISKKIKTVKLKITGMSCAGCANTIHNILENIPGVIAKSLEYPGDVITIKYDSSLTGTVELIKAIEKAGYKAEIVKKEQKNENKIN